MVFFGIQRVATGDGVFGDVAGDIVIVDIVGDVVIANVSVVFCDVVIDVGVGDADEAV